MRGAKKVESRVDVKGESRALPLDDLRVVCWAVAMVTKRVSNSAGWRVGNSAWRRVASLETQMVAMKVVLLAHLWVASKAYPKANAKVSVKVVLLVHLWVSPKVFLKADAKVLA